MANEEKYASLKKFSEELHAKKIFNLDTSARELFAIAEEFKKSSPGGEVAVNIIVLDNYFLVTPLVDHTIRPAELGSIKESVTSAW